MKRFQPLFAALMAILFVSSSAKAIDADHQSEIQRHADNKTRLTKLHPWMRPKVAAVISDLESHGYRPLIDGQVHRTTQQQAALVKKGVSKTLYSFHNVTGAKSKEFPNGKPESLAADITDQPFGWSSKAPRSFWLKMASSAENHQLATGIYWGLSIPNRQKLRLSVFTRKFDYAGPLGWDVAHNQPSSLMISIPEAKRGLRPPVKRVATQPKVKRLASIPRRFDRRLMRRRLIF